MKNEKDCMLQHINSITDKNNPLFKIIGYYLHDQECIDELKDYLGRKMIIIGFIIVLAVNILLFADMSYLWISHYSLIVKLLIMVLLVFVDYIVIKKYKSFIALCYSYKVLYLRIQQIPLDILTKVYDRILNQKMSL